VSFLDRFASFLGYERRAGASIKSDAYLEEFFGLRGRGGVGWISPDQALAQSAVATACVSRRAQGLASVPLQIHRNLGPSNAQRAEDHPLYDLLNVRPNDYQSAFEFREFIVRSHDMFGNAYARIERDGRGQVLALHPFPPGNVAVDYLPSGRLRYRARDEAGKSWTLLDAEMLHVRGPSRDGLIGLSPLQIARGAVALALEQATAAENLAVNGRRPSGVYSVEGKLDDAQHRRLSLWVAKNLSGLRNNGRPLILDNSAKYTPLAWSPEDSEFLASRKLSAEDVTRIFDVPPTSIGIVDRATYSNTEQEALALVRNCLAPLAARFESAFARCLLSTTGQRQFFFRHDFSELLRGDMKARFDAYRVGREIGVYSANDVRRLENEAPISNGETYNQPANWAPLGTVPAPTRGAGGGAGA
jgi:HK97 family phage portal protein